MVNPESAPPTPLVLAQKAAAEVDVIRRRELAGYALDAVADVLQVQVSVPNLLALTDDPDDTVRINAKRILRCVADISEPDSVVMEAIGQDNIYHYAEAVVVYGASRGSFLGLMELFGLPPNEVTGLYEVRRLVAEHTNDHKPGFAQLIRALYAVGLDPHQAAEDPEAAVDALDQAGCFIDHAGGVVFNRPIFLPRLAGKVPLRNHIDSVRNAEALMWVREQFGDKSQIDEEE